MRIVLGDLGGELVCSCLVMAVDADGSEVRTVEGIGDDNSLSASAAGDPRSGRVQCGFCTPGIVVAATISSPTPAPWRSRHP